MSEKTFKDVLNLFIIRTGLIFFLGYLSSLIVIKDKWFDSWILWGTNRFLYPFFRWDSSWYMDIVVNGYSYTPGQQSNIVFFPLYPFLIKHLAFNGSYIITGFIVSNLALLLACFYLFKLVTIEYNSDLAFKSVFFMLIFPASFFFSIMYTEGLFLFLSIGCFYYARVRSFKYSSLLGCLAALTKSIGVFLFIPLLIEYLTVEDHLSVDNLKKDVVYLLLIPGGLFIYMFYLWQVFGDPLLFIKTQNSWQRKGHSVLLTLQSTKFFTPFYDIIFIGALVFLFLALTYSTLKMRASYTVYGFVLFWVFISSGLLESMPRYVGSVFPIYISIALLADNSDSINCFYTIFSSMLLSLFLVLFVNGYWFT